MKRYILFRGSCYYPSGGMNDYYGSYDSVEEAAAAGRRADWYQVVDTVDWGVVDES